MKSNGTLNLGVKTAVQCGLILGWSSVIYLILYVPRLLKNWEAAAGEVGLSWRQQRLADASSWIQSEFNAIWAFWTMGAFTFVYFYWRFGRPSIHADRRAAAALVDSPRGDSEEGRPYEGKIE